MLQVSGCDIIFTNCIYVMFYAVITRIQYDAQAPLQEEQEVYSDIMMFLKVECKHCGTVISGS